MAVATIGLPAERLTVADVLHDEVYAVSIPANLDGTAVIAVHHVQRHLQRVVVRLHVCFWCCNLADNLAVLSLVFHDYSFSCGALFGANVWCIVALALFV
jgi:hypothetical protein